jgi:hypothetical protein
LGRRRTAARRKAGRRRHHRRTQGPTTFSRIRFRKASSA